MTLRNRPRGPRSLVPISALLLALLVAGCSSAGQLFQNAGTDLTGGAPAASPAASLASNVSDAVAKSDQRQIVKTGEVTIEVSNVSTAVGKVRALAVSLGGYVGDSQSGSGTAAATLTLRIPADRFDDALVALHKLPGDVVSEATREEDVTSALVDLNARITNLEASEVQYRALLSKAEKVADVLAVQDRLDAVRGQIEQLKAQQKQLSGQASLSTLTVTLSPSAVQAATDSWDPGKTMSDAYAELVSVGQSVGNGAIWFGIVWLPVLVVLAILVLLVRRFFPGVPWPRARAPKEE
jgi:Domain of unknown function (DUF4349)